MKYFVLIAFVGFVSCSSNGYDKNTLALSPVENIQLSFDLIEKKDTEFNSWVSSKGNVLKILNLPKLRTYVDKNNKDLLVAENYMFLWDTIDVSKKLYLIDVNKTHPLIVKSLVEISSNEIQNSNSKNITELKLTSKSKVDLGRFFANNIGKGLVLLDKNGFVASGENISRLDNGNLSID